MGTHNLSPEQIATAVSQAEDLAREGRYEEAGECASVLLPEITTETVPIDVERNRLKLRIYHVLHVCPSVCLVDAEHEDLSYLLGEVLNDRKKIFSPSDLVRAHLLLQICDSSEDPLEVAQKEKRELDALEAAQKILETETSSSYERALAYFLICYVTPDEEQEINNLRQLFSMRCENRPLMTTVGSCLGVSPAAHLKTGMEYLERAIKEAQDIPQYYTKLLRLKVHTLILQLMRELDSDDRERWYQAHESELHKLTTELLMNPHTSPKTMAMTYLSLCIYAMNHGDFASANLHLGIAAEIAQSIKSKDLLRTVEHYREVLCEEEKNATEEESNDNEDWWKHGGEPPV